MAFQAFTDNAPALLDTAFQSYASQGVTDIVVDLRYNGGGDVSTAEHLLNLLAPSSSNNKTMLTMYYNQTMVNGQATMLKNVLFDYDNPSEGNLYENNNQKVDYSPSAQTTNIKKAGSVNNLTKVYFIVSSSTASASEIVINCIAPYSTVTQLSASFSDTSTFTYGKPVGFFDIRIGQFTMWTPNFETKNANGYGDYYQGLQSNLQETVNKYQINRYDYDDVTHDFGDPAEACLADMIYAIAGVNTYASAPQANTALRSMSMANVRGKTIGNVSKINFMVGKPKRILKQ